MRTHPAFALLLMAVALLLGCGGERRYGDAGGRLVPFNVHLEREFVSDMHNRQAQPSVGVGVAAGSHGYSSTGVGVGFSFSSTDVYLLAGNGPAEAQVFLQKLKWGDNEFTVPLIPGRKLHLTAKVEGGREGWESLGDIVVPDAPDARIVIALDAKGPKVTVNPQPGAARTTDGGPAQERQAAVGGDNAAPEPPVVASGQAQTPPPGEHPDAGAKPPKDGNPPLKVVPGPPPGTAPVTAPAAEPARPFPDRSLTD